MQDPHRSAALYRRIGFEEVPADERTADRHLTYGDTRLVLSGRLAHDEHPDDPGEPPTSSRRGAGFALTIPTPDLDAVHRYWHEEGMLVLTALPPPGGVGRIFRGLDPDGYELVLEEMPEGG